MESITAWAKKVWKDRKTEYPTRRTLTKTNGSQEIVTVARNEGNVSQEGDAFSAANMNDLEERIDAGFTAVNGKFANKIDSNRFAMSGTGSISGFVKNNEVWLVIFNRISTPDSCVCVVSRYADVVSVYTVSQSETMNIEYNNQGTITVKYNGSTSGVYGGAFKIFG